MKTGRTVALILAVTGLMLLTSPAARAQPFDTSCVVGPGFGASLLFPYFEVDLGNPAGLDTLLSVNNGFSDPAMVRVVLWTDWTVPTIAFDLYLAGFDVQTLSLRQILNGNIPPTGAGADLSGFDFCDTLPPTTSNPALSTDETAQLQADHRGQLGPLFSDCAGQPYGDQIARGYITVDLVDECSGLEGQTPIFTPENTTWPYFGTDGIAINGNRLWGDQVFIDFAANFAQGFGAIPLWSDPSVGMTPPRYTFYGRYHDWDGRDERVPLPTQWDQRFFNGGPFAGSGNAIVWQDPEVPGAPEDCGMSPPWSPLNPTITSIDEDADNVVGLDGTLAGLATQRVLINDLAPPYDFGWIQVDSNQRQMWVQPTLTAGGLYSAGFDGSPTDQRLCAEVPPVAVKAPTVQPVTRSRTGPAPSLGKTRD